MKAVRIHNYGGPEGLITDDISRPTPAPGEILVHVRGPRASPLDWEKPWVCLLDYFDIPLPAITGRDFSGDVEELGEGVTGFEVGQPVFGTVGQIGTGSYAQYITVSPQEIVS